MPFIGQEPITGGFHKLDAITTSSTNTYNLLLNGGAYSPASANHLMVSLNGVIQSPGSSFTISGSQITFVPSSGTLSSSDSIDFIMAYGNVLDIGTPSDGTVTTNKIANSAVTDAKIAGMAASKLTGAMPALDGSALTGSVGNVVQVAEASGGGSGTQAFNGCFTSTYKFYLVLASISLDATAECYVRLQDSSNNERTSAVYYYATMHNSQSNGSNTHGELGEWGVAQFSPHKTILANNPHASYRIWVFNPTDTNMKTHMQMDFHSQASGTMNQTRGSCTYDSAQNDAGFRFIAASGNIKTTSQFKIYGFK